MLDNGNYECKLVIMWCTTSVLGKKTELKRFVGAPNGYPFACLMEIKSNMVARCRVCLALRTRSRASSSIVALVIVVAAME
jgi:hypothetical protein